MERSLSLDLLTTALAGRTGIPTAEQLQDLMGQMEVQLFLRRPELDPQLIEAAWYLHAVASVDRARDRYTPQRQRQAFQVSAHIFDLALQQDGWTSKQQLSLGFAAAIGYRRGGRDPNATAIMHRLRSQIVVEAPVVEHAETLPLEAGLAFLGFQPRLASGWFREWRIQLDDLARQSALPELAATVLGPAQLIILAVDDLLAYFTAGSRAGLERARTRLIRVINEDGVPEDLDARWVAAHLLALSDEAFAGSLWNPKVIPPEVPRLVRQAFTIGSPPVVTLWEPQRDLLTGTRSPFDPQIRRMVLAVPTSGGKTLLAQLLATEQLERTGAAVCYVAPTRSLCREVRQAMASRARILHKETGTDKPDFPFGSLNFAGRLDHRDADPPPDVEVMTPERLDHLLRHDIDGVLARFGMFIFDEAQHLKETSRGFVLESTIATLDYLTRATDHRIVLISAAMGNAGAIAQWISPGQRPLVHQSEWRGPRRLHAVFTTKAHFGQTIVKSVPRARKWRFQHITPLTGLIRLRLADGKTERLTTQDDTGWHLVRKSTTADTYQEHLEKDGTSTQQYKIASDMIRLLGHAGAVLVVASTRDQAQWLASALAKGREDVPALASMVDFIRGQLGPDHPLIGVLRRGAGFHHAGLPTEVQEALEQAVRDDILPYLTCTSTLTDGINLPVRTVVIYDQGYKGQPDDVRLRGARLVNAIGRAGRAGKETEGWIVLIRAAAPSESDFTDLSPSPNTLAVTSSLTTEKALEELAAFETAARSNEDVIFQTAGAAATSFTSFVWMMLAVEEGRGVAPDDANINAIVDATLAAQTLDVRHRFLDVAEVVRSKYRATDTAARRRWPRTGTSIRSARVIDNLAHELADTIVERDEHGLADPIDDPDYVLNSPRLMQALLELDEAPKWAFRTTSRGAQITVDPAAVLRDWLTGVPLSTLGDTYLAEVKDAAWRVEQIVDAATSHFEHYLSWTVGAVVELVNAQLALWGFDGRLCPELGGYIRYGVDNRNALNLMTSGIRSRRLAHTVSASLPEDFDNPNDLRSWLASMGVIEWRERYSATASELLDLLEFARVRRRSLLRVLLEYGTVNVGLPTAVAREKEGQISLEPLRNATIPAPLAVYAGDQLISTVASQDQADLTEILNTGVGTHLAVNYDVDSPTLTILLAVQDGD